ncbi:LacI family transcriptional regulator [Christensenellaceae bacterium OttesenSCG-928-M15]|nr:LacI family transcriptional regulator [Christensenellaceae bacterium OttesenSCG-928-M15]
MNIYDIANEAGVSIATVSRVINNKPNIHPKTVKKVKAVLEKHNYVPSSIARGLVLKSLRLVGIVLDDIRNLHYTKTAYTIEQALAKQDYRCIVCNVNGRNPEAMLKMLAESQVDGVIIVGSSFMNEYTEAAIKNYHADHPVVIVNGYLPLDNVCSILCDDRDGIAQSVEHLIQKGHRKILYIHDNDTDSAERKLDGYRTAMFKNGLTEFDEWIVKSPVGFDGGKVAGAEVLKRFGHDFTAVVCAEDTTALGLMRVLEKDGLTIPEDVAVTGYSNSFFGKITAQILTTVDTKLETLGSEAARALCDRFEGKDRPDKLTVSPELLIGDTT